MNDLERKVEAALFAAGKPLTLRQVARAVNKTPKTTKKTLDSIIDHYDHHGIELIHDRDLYELRIKDDHMDDVKHLAPSQDLTRGTLQTLAVIAYRNPIKQSEIIQMRGNKAYEQLVELEKKGFISRKPFGHTNKIEITRKFLDYFGLETPEEVKMYFENAGIAHEIEDGLKKKDAEPVEEQEEPIDAAE